MAQTTFRHGSPLMIDYTPTGGNVTAGDVVIAGNLTGITCGIAHLDIENNKLGALAAGGGVYDVVNLDNAADFTEVFWDNANDKVTTTSTNFAKFGYIVSGGGGGANSTAKALHHPYNAA